MTATPRAAARSRSASSRTRCARPSTAPPRPTRRLQTEAAARTERCRRARTTHAASSRRPRSAPPRRSCAWPSSSRSATCSAPSWTLVRAEQQALRSELDCLAGRGAPGVPPPRLSPELRAGRLARPGAQRRSRSDSRSARWMPLGVSTPRNCAPWRTPTTWRSSRSSAASACSRVDVDVDGAGEVAGA